jgi:hypothetical protein
METSDRSTIEGVFRDRARADLAVEQLKQAGFQDDHIRSTVFDLSSAGDVQHAQEASRIVVSVEAAGREPVALGILLRNGANNADLPPGVALVQGALVGAQPETTDLIPGQGAEEGTTPYTFFDNVKDPSHPGDIDVMDAGPHA